MNAAPHFASGRGRSGLTESQVYYVSDATGGTGAAAVRSLAAGPRRVVELTKHGSTRPPAPGPPEVRGLSQVCIPLEDVPVVAVTFSDGAVVRCPPHHRFLDKNRGVEVYAEHLQIGLWVSLPVYPTVGAALRWYVHRDPCSRRWAADPPYIKNPGRGGFRWFTTHTEALEHARRQGQSR